MDRASPKKELSHIISDKSFLDDAQKHQIDISKQFSHLSDIQAALLFYKTALAKENIKTIYADTPFVEREFITYIKATFRDTSIRKDIKSKLPDYGMNEKTFTGIRTVSAIAHITSERKNRQPINICWSLDQNYHKYSTLRDATDFISFTAFHHRAIGEKIIDNSCTYSDYDLKLEPIVKSEKQTNHQQSHENTLLIPFFRYIPSFSTNSSIPRPIQDLIHTLNLDKDKNVLLVTLGGPEHNVFLLYFINYLRTMYSEEERLIFDLANAWDYTYCKGNSQRENPMIILNSDGYIDAYIKKRPEENPQKLLRKNAAIFFFLEIKERSINTPRIDLLSIIGLSALYTKICTAYIVLSSLKGKFIPHVPGLYILEDNPEAPYQEEVKKRGLPFDDPVTMLDKVKDIILKLEPQPVAMGEFR